jgi:hypothetical protein
MPLEVSVDLLPIKFAPPTADIFANCEYNWKNHENSICFLIDRFGILINWNLAQHTYNQQIKWQMIRNLTRLQCVGQNFFFKVTPSFNLFKAESMLFGVLMRRWSAWIDRALALDGGRCWPLVRAAWVLAVQSLDETSVRQDISRITLNSFLLMIICRNSKTQLLDKSRSQRKENIIECRFSGSDLLWW